jgi:hypothetical protein
MMEPAKHRTCCDSAVNRVWKIRACWNTPVDALMRSVFIEVTHVLVHNATQLLLGENQDVVDIHGANY